MIVGIADEVIPIAGNKAAYSHLLELLVKHDIPPAQRGEVRNRVWELRNSAASPTPDISPSDLDPTIPNTSALDPIRAAADAAADAMVASFDRQMHQTLNPTPIGPLVGVGELNQGRWGPQGLGIGPSAGAGWNGAPGWKR